MVGAEHCGSDVFKSQSIKGQERSRQLFKLNGIHKGFIHTCIRVFAGGRSIRTIYGGTMGSGQFEHHRLERCFADNHLNDQCGGTGWTGATLCPDGWFCSVVNPYYSQCLQGSSTALPTSTVPGGTTPTTTASASDGTATLAPNYSWIRAVVSFMEHV